MTWFFFASRRRLPVFVTVGWRRRCVEATAPAETAPAVNMRVADAAPVEEWGGIDLGAELPALFDARPALEEVPADQRERLLQEKPQ